MSTGNQKIWFLQLIRVLACSFVVYTHWFGFLINPNVMEKLIVQDPIANYPHFEFTDYIARFTHFMGINGFHPIYFGLGLFFILSGYVIPLSLKNSTAKDYLIRRVFRIYPALIVCLLIAAFVMLFANLYLQSSKEVYFFQPKVLLANMLLLRDLVHQPYIEVSTWTLEIEIHFYVLFFLFAYFAMEKKIKIFLITASLMLTMGLFLIYLGGVYPDKKFILYIGRGIILNNNFLSFMFIGTTLYYTLSKQWTYFKGLAAAIILLCIDYVSLNIPISTYIDGPSIFTNHIYVVGIFLLLYFFNDHIPYSKILNKIAEISYPLYLIHGFTGYTLYFVLYSVTRSMPLSFIGTFFGVVLFVLLVHHWIEKPGISLSKKIINNKKSFLKFPAFNSLTAPIFKE